MAKEIEFPVVAMSYTSTQPTISYELSMDQPHTHYFDVKMSISGVDKDSLVVKMPVWTPGSYLVREFAKNIDYFQVEDDAGNPIPFEKVRKNSWHIKNEGKTVHVKYNVYSFEHSVRTSWLDSDHGYINGASVFMFVDGMLDVPSTINIKPHPSFKMITTPLKPTGNDQWTLHCPDYDTLVDSPIEIGTHELIKFEAGGIPHRFAIVGEANFDTDQMIADTKKIIEAQVEMFGDHPCEDYTFILHNTPSSYGGLEHLNSTCLIYPQWDYKPFDKYVRYLGLVSHEYFHLWNVKRIRPHALGPFDYDRENYTNLLWMAEGLTSYYDDLILLRAGIIDQDDYFKIIQRNINRVENTPGKDVQSLSDASFDAWIKYYRKNENTDNVCISYYSKGAHVGQLLDLAIRHHTKNERNLDYVLVQIYNEYYKKKDVGVTEKEYAQVIQDITGKTMDEFLEKYVYGTEPLDYNKYFAYAGLRLVNQNEKGKGLFFGVTSSTKDGKHIVQKVTAHSPAYEYGINVNDEIIAINGYRVEASLSKYLQASKPGDTVEVMLNRKGKIRTIPVVLDKNRNFDYKIEKVENPTALQKKIYEDWIGEKF